MAVDLEGAVLRVLLGALTTCESMASGAEPLLHNLAGAVGLSAGVLWVSDGRQLVTRATWAAERAEQQSLEKSAVRFRAAAEKGLAGSAWQLREPQLASATVGAERPGPMEGAGSGLRVTVAVPARLQDEVLGVVELYAGDTDELGDGRALVGALRPAAHLLGSVLDRWRQQAIQPKLTNREIELLGLSSHGRTTPQIAEELAISPWTVKTHFEHIRLKLDASDRAASVALALRNGIIA